MYVVSIQRLKRLCIQNSLRLLVVVSIVIVASGHLQAQMTRLNDSELSAVYAGFSGFSSFDITGGLARADFNINVSTFTEMDSLKLGYYSDGTTTDYGYGANGEGWDNDWTDVSFGSSSQDLVCNGLYIEAKFTNISDPQTRSLDYVRIGTPDMTGDISATFTSFSGYIDDGDGTPEHNDVYRLNLGAKTITATNSHFYISLENNATYTGYRVYFDNATVN